MNLSSLQQEVGVSFTDQQLLEQVFTHRSFLNESSDHTLQHNERLEFLGDAVLELAVTDYLYRKYLEPEGVLTSWRAALVRGERLGQIAEDLGFFPYLKLSKGEANTTGKARSLILANTLEAFIGAIYLDAGYDQASAFVNERIIIHLEKILADDLHVDPKSRLQEYLQNKEGITPVYSIVDQSGPDHDKVFTAAVFAAKRQLATGQGASKQRAETAAAKAALAKLIAK